MATNPDIPARYRHIIGTTSQWLARDLVIGNGEIAMEIQTDGSRLIKIGDGVSRWSQLEYYPDPTEIIASLRLEFKAADDQLRSDLVLQINQGDTANTAAITTESQVRASADSALGTRIDTLTASTNTNLNNLDAKITAETTARVQGDTALATRTTTLETTSAQRAVRVPNGIIEFFDSYADTTAMRAAVQFVDAGGPALITLVDVVNGGGSALQASGQAYGYSIRSAARIPITFDRNYRITFDLEAVGGAAGCSIGAQAFDRNGGRLFATTGGREHLAASDSVTLQAGERRRITGFLSGSSVIGGPGMGLAAPNRQSPHPWRQETADAAWFMSVFANAGALRIHAVELVEQTDAATIDAQLSARVTTEEQARIAGDTALATRTTGVEASVRNLRADSFPIMFGSFNNLDEMVAAGWTFNPILSSGQWALQVDANSGGGKSLVATSPQGGNLILIGPPMQISIHKRPRDVYSGEWILFRPAIGNAGDAQHAQIYAGWQPIDANGVQSGATDFGSFAYQVAGGDALRVNEGPAVRGYGSDVAAVGQGNNVGRPSPSITNPAPFPLNTVSIRPLLFITNCPAGMKVTIVSGLYERTTTEKELRASITTEQTARVSGDEALAQQIQQIIAEGSQGTQTFFQATAPANPEPGWVWFKDNGPGVADQAFRWSGAAWQEIDLSEPTDLTAVNARITTEEQARVAGDNALASRTSVVEANVANFGPRISATESGLTTANARITAEETARIDADAVLASRTTGVETSVNGLNARITVAEQSIDGIKAEYAVTVDANGNVVGFKLISGPDGGLFRVRADSFSVSNPGSPNQGIPVFIVEDGNVKINGALTVDVVQIDGVTIDTNAQGELTIKSNGVTTDLLAANAAVRPFTYSQIQPSEITFNPNVWTNVSVNLVPARVTVNNPHNAQGLVKFDVNLLVRNGGSDSDVANFRVRRGDGFILPTQYNNVWIDGRGSAYQNIAMTFFDIEIPPNTTHDYYFEMNSNDRSPIKALHILGLLFKNASTGTFSI